MRLGLITAIMASGCLLAWQGSALAQRYVPNHGRVYSHERPIYDQATQCDGTFDPYNGICYPYGYGLQMH